MQMTQHHGARRLAINTQMNLTVTYGMECTRHSWHNSNFMSTSGILSGSQLDQGHHPLCKDSGSYRSPHLIFFVLAMILIGCGGTPIFTLGTIYIDDHVRQEDSSMYIGCMYSTVAFGLVVGFLLGGYFITIHENSYRTGVIPADIYPGHPKWIGGWWCGFVLLGILLILISIPFFAFPKNLKKSDGHTNKKRNETLRGSQNKALNASDEVKNLLDTSTVTTATTITDTSIDAALTIDASTEVDPIAMPRKESCCSLTASSGSSTQSKSVSSSTTARAEYGRSLKEIPKCMWNLLSNPVFIVTCLGSCMELSIVSGFLVFLPKYLETQFTIGKSEANLFAGGIAVPGACIGIFLGGYLLKKFQLGIKGAIQFVLFFNLICMGLYTGLYFLGCDNMKMAGATLPYYNRFVCLQSR